MKSCQNNTQIIHIAVKSGRIPTLQFSEGFHPDYQNLAIKYLLLDVVLIIVLIILFELCHRVFNFLDELFS